MIYGWQEGRKSITVLIEHSQREGKLQQACPSSPWSFLSSCFLSSLAAFHETEAKCWADTSCPRARTSRKTVKGSTRTLVSCQGQAGVFYCQHHPRAAWAANEGFCWSFPSHPTWLVPHLHPSVSTSPTCKNTKTSAEMKLCFGVTFAIIRPLRFFLAAAAD